MYFYHDKKRENKKERCFFNLYVYDLAFPALITDFYFCLGLGASQEKQRHDIQRGNLSSYLVYFLKATFVSRKMLPNVQRMYRYKKKCTNIRACVLTLGAMY